ncbi:MAG: 3'-5' exonuclease [Clostridia bacterium]|nr:3'-5' exonuclease [Clostridia bacterium]
MKNSIINDVHAATDKSIIAFDFETTGLSAHDDRIIEVGAVKVFLNRSGTMQRGDILHIYIKPPKLVSEKITEITGITNTFLSDKPSEDDVFEDIFSFFGCHPIVLGHNVPFDIKFLQALYQRHNQDFKPTIVLDTLAMARDLLGSEIENHKLSTVAGYYNFDAAFHSAIEDIAVTVNIAEIFCKEYLNTEVLCKIKPFIKGVHYWRSFKLSRIYLNTNYGSIYMDARSKTWGSKDTDISQIDIDYLEQYIKNESGCSDLHQVVQYYYQLAKNDVK